MGEKIVVGPISMGTRTDLLPFVIDNDSFPFLINAYQWRGRIKRKRGTALLNRLRRYYDSTSLSYNPSAVSFTLDGGGNGNLFTAFSLDSFSPPIASLQPSTITLNFGGANYVDNGVGGISNGINSGTVNYATGDITIAAEAGNSGTAKFWYYPSLPVMGLEDFFEPTEPFPGTIGFDTTFAYNLVTSAPYSTYSVSWYKNPPSSGSYVQKTNPTGLKWNGADYQQFGTIGYQNAMWTTNALPVPFSTTNISMQFKRVTAIAFVVGSSVCTVDIAAHGLTIGDFLFFNELPASVVEGINFQTGYVTAVPNANQVTVTFANCYLTGAGGATATGIAQYLTRSALPTKDCLRWYDGDPTNGSTTLPVLSGNKGWVNFCPPLSFNAFSIGELPPKQYYLVDAKLIFNFKDRLIFLGVVVQASDGSPIYLPDTIVYSQNGTPYYTASYKNPGVPASNTDIPYSPLITFTQQLVPTNQTASPAAYFTDITGFGGFITLGTGQAINTVQTNEDAMIIGLTGSQMRLIYTGLDLLPFNAYLINSELGSTSSYSTINLDRSVVTVGDRGIIATSQVDTSRLDLLIPDQIFQFSLQNNGTERVSAKRDFINEWIYFSFLNNTLTQNSYFPNSTLLYNYREQTWGLFIESVTTYGGFRRVTGETWLTIGNFFPTWNEWNEPWNAGSSTLLQPEVILGNQQGYVLFRDVGTSESVSLNIKSFSGSTITSQDHGLQEDDYIIISGCLGTIGAQVNNKIFSVTNVTTSSFDVVPTLTAGTYVGGGQITRMYVPFIQTKQFPPSWGLGRKTRIGPQQYLLSYTPSGQVQLLIYLSQNYAGFNARAYNKGNVVPSNNVQNNTLIYSSNLYTCPESTNIGLTPANTNLQMVTAQNQNQIWHRMNTSLIGDTVQVGITLSDEQMESIAIVSTSFDITGATQAYPCVLTCSGAFASGSLIFIQDVEGMGELNENYYSVVISTATHVTINVDSTAFGAYTSGGTAKEAYLPYQFQEIELHAFILDVSPSQVLA